MSIKANKHEPLFHVSKNDAMPFNKALLIRVLSIVAALVVVGILSVVLIKENPFAIYGAIVKGAFVNVGTLIQDVSLLLMFGLAIIPAFQMKFWNLGANGQVLAGAFAAITCMKFIPKFMPNIPNALLIVIMFAASILLSVIWSVIPAIFKALFGTNETLFTLMMNYIAIALVDYFVFAWDESGSGTMKTVNKTSKLGWIPSIGNQKWLLIMIVALLLTIVMYVYTHYTKHGFEVQLVGESVNTAKYAGINVKKVVIRTLMFGGVICGVLGALYSGLLLQTINKDVGGLGFTAILVAWLANFDPAIMVFTSFFVVFLDKGAKYVSTVFQLKSNDYANIVVGIIFFFVIGCEFFIKYKIQRSNSSKVTAKGGNK